MQKLLEGVHRFQQREFGRYKQIFRRLSREGQKPHTLFITCADSRVVAELITQSKPGDLFVIKNVSNIVVCGHSQCGAISALMEFDCGPHELKHLRNWISLALPVRKVIERDYG